MSDPFPDEIDVACGTTGESKARFDRTFNEIAACAVNRGRLSQLHLI